MEYLDRSEYKKNYWRVEDIMKKMGLKISLGWIITLILLLQIFNFVSVYAEEQKQNVTILFTHDMHDNLLPFRTKQNGSLVTVGGYARLYSAIKEQKLINPHALLVDGGDFSMGTPFQTIYQSDAPELRLLGQMGYDAVTLGNHEFDYRAAGLSGSLKAALQGGDPLPVIVQSNVTYPTDKDGTMTDSLQDLRNSMEAYGVKDYIVLERDGIKIGIFGLMGEEAASMAPKSEVVFEDKIIQAKRVVKKLKDQEQVDIILCLSHTGTKADKSISEDEILAKEVPEINVIISGHTHTKLAEPILIGSTIIASAENYGMYLGVIDITKSSNGNWEIGNYELIEINKERSENESIKQQIAGYKQLVQEKYFDRFHLKYDDIVALSDFSFQTPEEIFAVHSESTIGNLISDSYIYAVKKAEGDQYVPVDAAIVPCGTIRGTIMEGNLTVADAFSISSLGIGADGMPGYPLISVYLSGKELKTACEVDASITPLMGDAQLYMSGVNFTFNPNRLIFNKVIETSLVKPDGSKVEIEDTKLYRVVCNLYSAQMLSIVGDKSYGLMSIIPKTRNGEVITDFEEQIIYNISDGTNSELKEWYAVVQYLQSFDQIEGKAKIPDIYKEPQGRKIIENSYNIIDLLEKPNHISLTVYIVVPIFLILLVFLITKLTKRIRRRKRSK
jgi:2',3'-cyclic-nucleotide 2'-phosphodiesterase (5'-nucleotidase family)